MQMSIVKRRQVPCQCDFRGCSPGSLTPSSQLKYRRRRAINMCKYRGTNLIPRSASPARLRSLTPPSGCGGPAAAPAGRDPAEGAGGAHPEAPAPRHGAVSAQQGAEGRGPKSCRGDSAAPYLRGGVGVTVFICAGGAELQLIPTRHGFRPPLSVTSPVGVAVAHR